MTQETMLLKKLTNKQLLKELNFRIKNNAAIKTHIAKTKKEQLEYEVREAEDRIEQLEDLISDLEVI